MSIEILSASYIGASILFILSLGGLSNQESAQRGNIFGIAGMGLAIIATIFSAKAGNHLLILIMITAGGMIGLLIARRVEMTAMPQLVAILHCLVGLAAVIIGLASFLEPAVEYSGVEKTIHDIEIYIGVLIGAVTFTGSIAAFGKLQSWISSSPLLIPGRHALNIIFGIEN